MGTKRPRRRAAAALVAVFLGLAGLGATTGAALGTVGAASASDLDGHHRHGGHGSRPLR